MEIEKPNYSFADISKPHSAYQDERIDQLTKCGINHADCLETLLQRVEELEAQLKGIKQIQQM